jgi:hypothetical protein
MFWLVLVLIEAFEAESWRSGNIKVLHSGIDLFYGKIPHSRTKANTFRAAESSQEMLIERL